MAVGALKLDPEPYAKPAVEFFGKNAKTFEEVRIAVAGLEAIKTTSPDSPSGLDRTGQRGTQRRWDVRRRRHQGQGYRQQGRGAPADGREARQSGGHPRHASRSPAGGWRVVAGRETLGPRHVVSDHAAQHT